MITPRQTLTAFGQRTFATSLPDALTMSEVLASVAASELDEDPRGA